MGEITHAVNRPGSGICPKLATGASRSLALHTESSGRSDLMRNHGETMKLEPAQHLIEEGAAASLALASLPARSATARRESYDVIVIGGGQAGLSVGYHLARAGLRFTILDAHERVGDAWRKRWDSLRLFTPAKFDGLDGMRFPAPRNSFPTKNQMADYL